MTNEGRRRGRGGGGGGFARCLSWVWGKSGDFLRCLSLGRENSSVFIMVLVKTETPVAGVGTTTTGGPQSSQMVTNWWGMFARSFCYRGVVRPLCAHTVGGGGRVKIEGGRGWGDYFVVTSNFFGAILCALLDWESGCLGGGFWVSRGAHWPHPAEGVGLGGRNGRVRKGFCLGGGGWWGVEWGNVAGSGDGDGADGGGASGGGVCFCV
jgi:hypothetical protein